TLVYELARWRNARDPEPMIPESVLTKPPSAELRPGQLDVDTLPPDEELDPILELYVERDWGVPEFRDAGFDVELVRRVIGMVDRSEYKRRQAPPGIKVTPRAFGKDRRLPLTWRARGWGEGGAPTGPEGPRGARPGARSGKWATHRVPRAAAS